MRAEPYFKNYQTALDIAMLICLYSLHIEFGHISYTKGVSKHRIISHEPFEQCGIFLQNLPDCRTLSHHGRPVQEGSNLESKQSK